jgi:hypothetical protein
MEERYIKAIDPDKWIRPAGWLTMPTITSSQNKLAFLFAVYANEENCMAISYGSSTCNYDVDWGDGTTLNVINTVATQSKRYDYASISSIVLQDRFGIDYKQVIITVTLNSGVNTIWSINAAVVRAGKSQILESIISHSHSVSFLGRISTMMQSLKIVKLVPIATVSTHFANLIALRNFEGFENIDTTSTTTSGTVFANMGPVWQPLNFTWNSGAGAMTGILAGCRMKKFGNMTFNGSGGLSTAMSPNPSLEEIGNLNLGNHNTLTQMLQNCFNLQKIGTITANGSAPNLSSVFQNCYSLQEIVFTNAANVTVTTLAFANCHALRRLVLPGITVAVSIVNACMQKTALVELFTSLGTPGVLTNITITGNPGIPDLTAADYLIATSKNWSVIIV